MLVAYLTSQICIMERVAFRLFNPNRFQLSVQNVSLFVLYVELRRILRH